MMYKIVHDMVDIPNTYRQPNSSTVRGHTEKHLISFVETPPSDYGMDYHIIWIKVDGRYQPFLVPGTSVNKVPVLFIVPVNKLSVYASYIPATAASYSNIKNYIHKTLETFQIIRDNLNVREKIG